MTQDSAVNNKIEFQLAFVTSKKMNYYYDSVQHLHEATMSCLFPVA